MSTNEVYEENIYGHVGEVVELAPYDNITTVLYKIGKCDFHLHFSIVIPSISNL